MGEIIALASGKGGVGKTVATAALGMALCAQGQRVLLLDADMGLRDLDLVLGVHDRVLFDVFDVATGRAFEEDAVVSVCDGLDFLPASQFYRWEEVAGDAVLTVLEDAKERYDMILIDCPAGIGKGFYYAFELADQVIVVVEPTPVSIRDSERVMKVLSDHRRFRVGTLLNNCAVTSSAWLAPEEMIAMLMPERLLGIWPHEEEIVRQMKADELFALPSGWYKDCVHETARALIEDREMTTDFWEHGVLHLQQAAATKRDRRKRRESAQAWRQKGRW